MDMVQQLLQVLHVYQDNGELIASAVKDLRKIEASGLAALKRGLEERKRKHILKAIALLSPSDIPAKVVEVDGLDDAELAIFESRGWTCPSFSIYLRHSDLINALAKACSAIHGVAIGFYAHSILPAVWDHIDLGHEHLVESEKPLTYQCAEHGRQVFENAHRLCHETFQASSSMAEKWTVIAFEAVRDDHRRFSVLSAVLMEPQSGLVLVVTHDQVLTSPFYTLDRTSQAGLEYCVAGLGNTEHQDRVWATLNALCSMFAEVHKMDFAIDLVRTVIECLAEPLHTARDEVSELPKRDPPLIWIPSRQDLKDIHNRNDERVRSRAQRGFRVRDKLFESVKAARPAPGQTSNLAKALVLECMADPHHSSVGRKLVGLYEQQSILPCQDRDTGNSSTFATYIYSCLHRSVVAEEYRHIFSSGKVNIRRAKSGTLIFVPQSGSVTMTTHGMVCEPIKIVNSQLFTYSEEDRFVLLPHLIALLDLRNDDALLSTFVREMDDNAYLIADPLTMDVRACMTRSFEMSRKTFKVSTLHEDARKLVGNDHYAGLVREAISLLARLGATVPVEYINRSCFFDVTRDLKGYRGESTRMQVLFDRGVVLDGLVCDIRRSGKDLIAKLHIAVDGGCIIATLRRDQLRKHRPTVAEESEEMQGLRAAVEAAGVEFTSIVYDVHGDVRLAVTRSDPGSGIFCLFEECEAR